MDHQVRAGHAVDRRVVHLRDRRDVAVLQALDDVHLPQRTGPVERTARDVADELRELLLAAGSGTTDPADVVVEVELGVLDPHRVVQVERDGRELAPERLRPGAGGLRMTSLTRSNE